MVSVIIPFYNTGEVCAELVRRLLHDRQRKLEIICVDDCSTDGSLKKVAAACRKDKRARVIHLAKNGGAAAARNRGLDEAQGEYIVFIDSDDDVAEVFLTKMLEAMENPAVCLAVCGIRQNYLRTNRIVDKFTQPASPRHDDEAWAEYIVRLMVEDAHLYSSVNKMYRAEIIRRGKVRFDASRDFAEDTKFVLDYLRAADTFSEICFVPDPLYTYNYGTKTSTVSKSALVWQNWERNYTDFVEFVGSEPSARASRLLRRLHGRFKISHALAVARSNLSWNEKCKYENWLVLLGAEILVKIRR